MFSYLFIKQQLIFFCRSPYPHFRSFQFISICMVSSTGWMSLIEYDSSWQCSCIDASVELLRRTWWTVVRWQQTSLVVNICGLPLSASWSYRATDWTLSVVGILLLRARRLGIHCLTAFVTQSWVSTLSSVNWRHTFLPDIDDKTY